MNNQEEQLLNARNAALEKELVLKNRELEIEAALEIVRARTMAMQKSEELSDTAYVLFQQFMELGENPHQITIGMINEAEGFVEFNITGADGSGAQINRSFKFDINEPSLIQKLVKEWKENKKSSVIELAGKDLADWVAHRNLVSGIIDNIDYSNARRFVAAGFFTKGLISISTVDFIETDTCLLLERFAKVFEQTYTRFLDLQKAEAQAREAEIELALERVRARAMAMQNSDELAEAAVLLFQQVRTLGIQTYSSGFTVWENNDNELVSWMCNADGSINPPFRMPAAEIEWHRQQYESWKKKEDYIIHDFTDKEIQDHYAYLRSFPLLNEAFKTSEAAGVPTPVRQVQNAFNFSHGNLLFITLQPVPETYDILKRFAKVFDQTYTRFLDIQKAEVQAREAKIEAALERVRSRTMAMQKSDELTDVAGSLFTQVNALGIKTWTAGFNVWSEDNNSYVDYITSPNGGFIEPYTVHTEKAEALKDISDARKSGVEFEVQYVEGDKIKKLYQALTGLGEKQFEKMLQDGVRFPSQQYEHFVFGSKVSLMFITYEPVPEAHDIFRRLGKVFEQTYTRFLDLQKAEAQAREAIKASSLDRVRGEIASMRNTADLDRITPLIWKELTALGISFIRCGVFIMDGQENKVYTYLSMPDGSAIAAFHTPMDTNGNFAAAVDNWRKQKMYTTHWMEKDFMIQADELLQQGAITNRDQYLNTIPKEGFHLHFLPFMQGMLYVGCMKPLHTDDLQLVQALADSFSVAYARYEDFTRLESAKQLVEKTLVDLKQAQQQLIQSEKMASLGELTAGIAHEIQNPLNFVNNFSEVSKELLDEMKTELDKGNTIDAKEIANDVIQNLEKINHHGKRADAIVKGMLQHSQSSTGQKEATDINKLADEYLRLAYHGLRGKDNSFNATLKTDFDASVGSLNIIPQDIGRVLLNLYNNAFYAVNEKSRSNMEGFEPTVSVSTKKINSSVEIRVSDNGNGIPQKIVDKIFQPFFTTKPTGQGTGLGLSLSYDIVKVHGGEIKVESKDGTYTEFSIILPF